MKRPFWNDRRLQGALVASALLHGLCFWWVASRAPVAHLTPPGPEPASTLTWIDAEPTAGVHPVLRPPVATTPAAHATRERHTHRAASTPPSPLENEPAVESGARATNAPESSDPGVPDVPTALASEAGALTPTPGLPVPNAFELPDADPGVTMTGAEAGRALADSRRQSQKVGARRVQGFVDDTIAGLNAELGRMDPQLADLRAKWNAALAKGPDSSGGTARGVAGEILKSWQAGAEKYGATGTPFAEPEGYRRENEVMPEVDRAAAAGSPDAIKMQKWAERGARFRDFGDGRTGPEFVAIVEIAPGHELAPLSLTLLQPSGVTAFDAWVIERAGKTFAAWLETAKDPEAIGRTVWAFRGRVVYWRDRRDIDPKTDVAYLTLAGMLGLATGRFDEMTGSVEYVDLLHPHFTAKATLLGAYPNPRPHN